MASSERVKDLRATVAPHAWRARYPSRRWWQFWKRGNPICRSCYWPESAHSWSIARVFARSVGDDRVIPVTEIELVSAGGVQ